MNLSDVEIITPSGLFASIRTPTVFDAFASGMYDKTPNWSDVLLKLCLLCVTLDGQKISIETLGNLPIYEVRPVMDRLVQMVIAPPWRVKP